MTRRFIRSLIVATSLSSVALVPSVSDAAGKDKAAQKLQRDAMDNDYLATKFPDAEAKLRKAIKLCGADACSPKVLAQLHRDLGVVLIGGENKKDEGKGAFLLAFKADPGVALDKDLTTPDIQKAFEDAKKGGGKATAAPADEEEEEEEEPKPKPKPKKKVVEASSDMVHTPPTESPVLTPVPLYVELPEDVTAVKVQVRYKPFGAPEWKTLELRKMGGGWGAEIPCLEIGSTTGDLSYYVQAVDASGDVVSTSGNRNTPNKLPIKNELKGDAPRLPGKPPPAACDDPNACPPGFPCAGKKPKKGAKGWGASCEADKECGDGLLCKSGSCESGEAAAKAPEPTEEPAKGCESDLDCDGGVCSSGQCQSSSSGKKNWGSVSIEQDIALVSGSDVCSAPSQTDNGYSCFRGDGQQYHGTPLPGTADAISGGVAPATTRILAGYDRVVLPNVTVGARLGYALRGGPKPDGGVAFLPVHAEARVAYWLGRDPFSRVGLRPYVFAAGGLAQVDVKVQVQVREDVTVLPIDRIQPDNPDQQTLDAWKKMGQSFGAIGGGVMYATSARSGIVGDLKLMMMFPSSGFVVAPEIGYVVGF